MCLIILKDNNVDLVPKETIAEVWIDNPHGAGIIFKRHKSDNYQMVKGLMTEQSLHDMIDKLKLSDADFVAYHLRWATSGKLDAANTHPFIVHEDVGEVSALTAHNSMKTLFIMHNGVIHDLNDKKAEHSDTIRFISEYLSDVPMYDLFHNEAIQAFIEKFIDGSRLFIAHSKYGHKLFGEWHEHGNYTISKEYSQATKSSQYVKPKSYYGKDLYNWDMPYETNYNQISFWDELEDKKKDSYEWCDGCGACNETVKYNRDFSCYICSHCKKEFEL
tara:strand:- start:254 stop:1078 length:825 start_codon:yes stop_codon:yes gene_type:complete